MVHTETRDAARATPPAPKSLGRPLRVGIAGAGFIGRVHAQAARAAGACVVGVAAATAARAASACQTVGAERGYDDVEALLGAGLDVLHICVPNALHHQFALAAIERDVHVVCEKPLTTSISDALELVAAAERRRVVGTVPFVYRFHPMVREMRSRAQGGELGRVGLVSGSYLQDWLADGTITNWRTDRRLGGTSRAFADIGSHWFDLIEFVRGVHVEQVSARASTVVPRSPNGDPEQTEDTVTAQFVMEDGVIGVFAASQAAQGRKNRLSIELSGERSSLFFDQEDPERLWQGNSTGGQSLVRDPNRLSPDAARLAFLPAGHAQGFQDCFNAFVADSYALIGGDQPSGLPTLRAGLRSVEIVDAVVRSAQNSGAWVDVAPRKGQHA